MSTATSTTLPTKEEFVKIVELAVELSGGRLRMAHNEEDENRKHDSGASQFLKLDEKRLGRDLELYGFAWEMGREQALLMFFEEVVLPLRGILPESYAKASEALRELGSTVYSGDALHSWSKLFLF